MKIYIVELSTGEQFALRDLNWDRARRQARRLRRIMYPGTSIVSVNEWTA